MEWVLQMFRLPDFLFMSKLTWGHSSPIMCSKKWWLPFRNEKTVYPMNGPCAQTLTVTSGGFRSRNCDNTIECLERCLWNRQKKKFFCDSDSRACEERVSLGDCHKPFDLRKDTLATIDCFLPLRVKQERAWLQAEALAVLSSGEQIKTGCCWEKQEDACWEVCPGQKG